MAFNVYLTLFQKYNAQQLKALEWKYHVLCYGAPFIIAFTLIFVETQDRGRIYGPAVVSLIQATLRRCSPLNVNASSGVGSRTSGASSGSLSATVQRGMHTSKFFTPTHH